MPIQQLFSAGGVVLWPLLGFSLLAVALILERLFFWVRITGQQDRVAQHILSYYQRHADSSDVEIRLIASLQEYAHLPIARIFLAALTLEKPTPEDFRLALETAAQREFPLLRRFNTVFETIISVSPLLGLLGTILGLIQSFASLRIGDMNSSNSTNVTAGISEALISTAAGLIVAIITLLFTNLFRGLYQRQRALIIDYGGQIELIYRRRYEKFRGQLF